MNRAILLCLLLGMTGPSIAEDWQMPPESARCPSRWGAADQRGAANLMTSASIVAAMRLVKTGEMFELGEVLTDDPAVSYINRGRQYNLYTKPAIPVPDTRVSNEELVITELGQIGTQLDGFAHQMYGDAYYNCFRHADIAGRNGFSKLGIEQVGTLISRGVLIDVAAFKGVATLPMDYTISASDIIDTLAHQGVSVRKGDSVLINTGWAVHRGQDNDRYGGNSPGIGTDAAAWLVEQDVMLIGADNCCIETRSPAMRHLPVHAMLLIQHGIYLVENMVLADLASARAYEFAFMLQPLKLKGATGAAVAPVAIR